jgi:mono/diheme cytochrome c family protein
MIPRNEVTSMCSSIRKKFSDAAGTCLRSAIFKLLSAASVVTMTAVVTGCDRKSAEGSVTPSIPVRSFSAALKADQSAGSATQASDVEDGNSDYVPDAEVGREVFVQTCATCHGFQAQGLPHQGAALRTSPFVASKTDKDLIAFIRKGRLAKDPANKSGAAMPPSGNNAALSDARLADVVAYLRQVQEEAKAENNTDGPATTTSAAK